MIDKNFILMVKYLLNDFDRNRYLTFILRDKERHFALPDCVSNGFVILEDDKIISRCRKKTVINGKIDKIRHQQCLKHMKTNRDKSMIWNH